MARSPVARQQWIRALELPEQPLDESGRGATARQAVVHPLPLPQALDQPRLAEDFEMSRYPRLTLAHDLGDVGDAELARGAQSKQPQPCRLAGGSQPGDQQTLRGVKASAI